MSASNVVTGVGGRLAFGDAGGGSEVLIARLMKWSLSPSAIDHAWGDSSGGGYTLRKPGRKDLTGSCEGTFDSATTIWSQIREGAELSLILYVSSTIGWNIPNAVIVTGPDFGVDVDTEEPTKWAFAWGTCGIYYAPSEAGAPALPTLPSS